jgi:hypothetical protein
MKFFGLASLLVMTLVTGISASACSTIDHAFDCNQICNRYKDCVNASYDADACTSRCRDNADNNEGFANAADDCQACVDDRSCAGAVFGCSTECAPIVP